MFVFSMPSAFKDIFLSSSLFLCHDIQTVKEVVIILANINSVVHSIIFLNNFMI